MGTRLCASWFAIVRIHRELIWRGPVRADLQEVDLNLSGSDLAETICDEEGRNVAAR